LDLLTHQVQVQVYRVFARRSARWRALSRAGISLQRGHPSTSSIYHFDDGVSAL